jgi:hypothetical protein
MLSSGRPLAAGPVPALAATAVICFPHTMACIHNNGWALRHHFIDEYHFSSPRCRTSNGPDYSLFGIFPGFSVLSLWFEHFAVLLPLFSQAVCQNQKPIFPSTLGKA